MYFSVNFAKFLRTHFFTENFWWLLLKFKESDQIQMIGMKLIKLAAVIENKVTQIY